MSDPTHTSSASSSKSSIEFPGTVNDGVPTENAKICPDNCDCPHFAAKSEEYAKPDHAMSWIDTKEGQNHLRICVESCPYRAVEAQGAAAPKEEQIKRATEEELLKNHLRICVKSCPYRVVEEGDHGDMTFLKGVMAEKKQALKNGGNNLPGGETESKETAKLATHITIVQGISTTEPSEALKFEVKIEDFDAGK